MINLYDLSSDEGSDGIQLDLDLLQATTLGVQRQIPVEQQKYLGHNPFLDVSSRISSICCFVEISYSLCKRSDADKHDSILGTVTTSIK